jgi:twinkle protein
MEGQKKSTKIPSVPKKRKEGFSSTISEDDTKEMSDYISKEALQRLFPKGIPDRGISEEIAEFFNVKVEYNDDGEIVSHMYPYSENCWKVRKVKNKEFVWYPKKSVEDLFGRAKFPKGGKKLVITEGELDAMAIAQASYDRYDGKIYPVISVPSATNLKCLIEHRDYIRSYKEVILFFDNDEAGRKAAGKAAKIIGADKVKIVSSIYKDACDMLKAEGSDKLMFALFDAQPYTPAGIIDKDEVWRQIEEYNNIESLPYPDCIKGLNEKLKGIRQGEITLFISGTGAGKSSLMREIMVNVLEREEDTKIGVISLEESPAETGRKLAGMALNKNPSKEMIPLDELKIGFDKVFGDDRITILDHQGAVDDEDIIDKLEYMCLTGCVYLFIDHITILVSEGAGGLVGNEAQDKIMNSLLKLVKRHNVWIGLVSHLRKTAQGQKSKSFEEGAMPTLDDVKGSGSIKQIAFDIVAFARDMTADTEEERNTIKMSVLKSRYTGLTGKVPGAIYDYDTGRLNYMPPKPKEDFKDVEVIEVKRDESSPDFELEV